MKPIEKWCVGVDTHLALVMSYLCIYIIMFEMWRVCRWRRRRSAGWRFWEFRGKGRERREADVPGGGGWQETGGDLGWRAGRCERIPWPRSFPLILSAEVLVLNSYSWSLPSHHFTKAAAKVGRVSGGTVPLCVLPSARFHSLTVRAWSHTQPSRSAAQQPHAQEAPQSKKQRRTYETVSVRKMRAGESLD